MPSTQFSPLPDLSVLPDKVSPAPSTLRNGGPKEDRPFAQVLAGGSRAKPETPVRRSENAPAVSSPLEQEKCDEEETDTAVTTDPINEAQAQQAMQALLFVPARPDPLPTEIEGGEAKTEEEGIEELDTEEENPQASSTPWIAEEKGEGNSTQEELLAGAFDLQSRRFSFTNQLRQGTNLPVAKESVVTGEAGDTAETPAEAAVPVEPVRSNSLGGARFGVNPVSESGFAVPSEWQSVRTRQIFPNAPTLNQTPAVEGAPRVESQGSAAGVPLESALFAAPGAETASGVKTAEMAEVAVPAPGKAETVVAPKAGTVLAANSAEITPAKPINERTRVNPLFGGKKERTLSVDGKEDVYASRLIGMNVAMQGETSMSPHRHSPLSPVSQTFEVTPRAAEVAAPASTPSSVAAQAVKVVQDIKEIGETLSAQRRHVNLNFDFGTEGRLDVRVEVRNGEVHTQFRTDSTELREALQQAWNSQGLGQEGRARLAEPAFLPAARNEPGTQQSFADAQGRQQRQQAGEPSLPALFARSSSVNTPTVSSPSTPVVASDRQLHVLA